MQAVIAVHADRVRMGSAAQEVLQTVIREKQQARRYLSGVHVWDYMDLTHCCA